MFGLLHCYIQEDNFGIGSNINLINFHFIIPILYPGLLELKFLTTKGVNFQCAPTLSEKEKLSPSNIFYSVSEENAKTNKA